MQRMLLAVLIWYLGTAGIPDHVRAQDTCGAHTCATAGTRLVSFDTSRSAVLNALLSSLTGSSIKLSVADYNALASADINLGLLLARLKTDLDLVSIEDVLDAGVSLETIFQAAASVLVTKDGLIAVGVLDKLIAYQLPAATIALGDLLKIDLRQGALLKGTINLLDLVTGTASLFNHKHAIAVENVKVAADELGIAIIKDLDIGVTVPVPPIHTCGPEGSSFQSASIRLRAHADLINVTTSALSTATLGLLGAELSIGQLDLVIDVAPGLGVLESIDAVTGAVTVRATPGVVSVLLGKVSDANLLDKTDIDPATELGFATIGALNVRITTIDLAVIDVAAKAAYIGNDPSPTNLEFSKPYPETLTARTQADFVPEILEKLLSTVELRLSILSGAVSSGPLTNLTSQVLALLGAATNPLKSTLETLVTGLVNPLLDALGIGLGELDVTLCDPYYASEGTPCEDGLFCTNNDSCDGAGSCFGSNTTCGESEELCQQSYCDEETRSCGTEPSGCLVEGTCFDAGYQVPNECYICNPREIADDFVEIEDCTPSDGEMPDPGGEFTGPDGNGSENPETPDSNDPIVKSNNLAGGCSVSAGSQNLGEAFLFLLAVGLFYQRRRNVI